jgi:hypothetical protein
MYVSVYIEGGRETGATSTYIYIEEYIHIYIHIHRGIHAYI